MSGAAAAAARKLTNCSFITNISLKKALKLNLSPGRVATVPDRCARQNQKKKKKISKNNFNSRKRPKKQQQQQQNQLKRKSGPLG